MRIAILGGTGDIGEGLALRWGRSTNYELVVGSRERDRAVAAAERYRDRLAARGHDPRISGAANASACEEADVIVLSVPPYAVADLVSSVADAIPSTATLVSPAVGLNHDDAGHHYHRPAAGSVTALVRDAAPETVSVTGAFHSLPAGRLRDLDDPLGLDTVVVGDDPDARAEIIELGDMIEGIRAYDGGPIDNAAELEGLTPLLINLAEYNENLADAGVRFVTHDPHRTH